MKLNDVKVRNLKSDTKPYKVFDGGGLYVEVKPTGGKLWRYKFRYGGKEQLLPLGKYPEVSLKDARASHAEAKKVLSQGINPCALKRASKLAAQTGFSNSFETVAREWHEKKSPGWSSSHKNKVIGRLEQYVFPWLGNMPIADIKAPEVLAVLRRIETKGIMETAHRVRGECSQVFRYAIATGRAERDVCADLRGALAPVKTKHLAAVTEPADVGRLLLVL